MCCHNGDEPPVAAKNYIKFNEKKEYLCSDISTDGRFIVILPKESESLQIWYNHLYYFANDSAETMEFGLSCYNLEHDSEVLIFKLKLQNFYESVIKYIPNIIATITADYKVHLWSESFTKSGIEFYEFEIIDEFSADRIFPLYCFVNINYKEEVYSYERNDVSTSRLMNPHSDKIFYLLKDHNDMGIIKPNYPFITNDWLCFITVNLLLTFRKTIFMYTRLKE